MASYFDNLFKMFGYKLSKDYPGGVKQVVKTGKSDSTTSKNSGERKDRERFVAKNFDPLTRELYKQWQRMKITDGEIRDRFDLYQEMENMFMNSAIMSRARHVYRDEVVQGDDNTKIVSVHSTNHQLQKDIEDFLDEVLSSELIYSTFDNLIAYGDAYWFLNVTDRGVNDILEVDVRDVIDRIEFTPHQISKMITLPGGGNIVSQMTNDKKLKMLIDMVSAGKLEDYSSFFKSYLFGFQISEFIVPPWNCVHFRNYTTNDLFYPFGIPQFLHSLYPYKQYEMGLAFQSLLRQAKFPIDVYKIKIAQSASPADAIENAMEFIREFDNSGLRDQKKEDINIGERLFTFMDLFEYEQKSSNFDLGRIEDIEMQRDDMILSTNLPRNMLDPNNGSFGNSGISLIEQFKPFAREAYKYQTIFLEKLIQVIKIHFIVKSTYSYEDLDFTLSMPFPESQTNPEIVQSQSERFRLAGDILDALKSRLLGEDAEVELPIEVVQDVFERVLPFDKETVDKWILQVKKQKEELVANQETTEEEGSDSTGEYNFKFESKKFFESKTVKESYNIVFEEIVKSKLNSYRGNDYIENKKHFVTSGVRDKSFDARTFEDMKIKSIRRSFKEDRQKSFNERFIVVDGYEKKPKRKKSNKINESNLPENSVLEENTDIDFNDIVTED